MQVARLNCRRRHVTASDKNAGMSPRDCWKLSWVDAKQRKEDGWLSGTPNSALSPRNWNGDGQPGLSVPDGGTLALALAASGESRALPEAALSASLWYADIPLSLISNPFLHSLCALVCILINRHRMTLSYSKVKGCGASLFQRTHIVLDFYNIIITLIILNYEVINFNR